MPNPKKPSRPIPSPSLGSEGTPLQKAASNKLTKPMKPINRPTPFSNPSRMASLAHPNKVVLPDGTVTKGGNRNQNRQDNYDYTKGGIVKNMNGVQTGQAYSEDSPTMRSKSTGDKPNINLRKAAGKKLRNLK